MFDLFFGKKIHNVGFGFLSILGSQRKEKSEKNFVSNFFFVDATGFVRSKNLNEEIKIFS